ncbi:fatty acid desaturase [Paenibacillus chondroitinus]|uniref:Fatty acid desaturase n=1 Tax=Paenibacillus chondroitinus TaxID=59842 RepID=A0ABU6DBJ9_9BACL|nr:MULTISPECIES: fatty acid desaturase [Paenibacillus]MCY9662314.1 fatty acid desaturase [Paenibacillus anseongense]MEB4794647.1 fatty acid desaturase [Paenibacillus chondroitinus]
MTQSTLTHLKKQVAPYEKSNTRASIKQLFNTLGPLFVLWLAAYLSLSISYWITLPITIIASGFVIRTFIIFHDCCHQSFFKSRRANEIIGTITGILTLFPYQQWKNSHSIHHATSGNLEKRGIGDMWVLTVDEYAASSLWVRIAYRLYRNPFIMFGLGPVFLFLFTNRFNTKGARRKERISTYMTNVFILALYGGLIWIIGWQSFVLIQAPIMFIAGLMGIWLFYVQHQFEDSYFENEDEWSYVKAAVDGSSYYKLPKILQWITGNIGFHHVHHLSPKVPNYNLEKAHNATPPLQKAVTITIRTSLKALSFRLWDERSKTFVDYKNSQQVHLKEDEHDTFVNKIKVKVRESSLQG